MMTEQLEDAEVIAALGAFQPYRTVVWPLASKLDMRRALDAASTWRSAQPTSGLADLSLLPTDIYLVSASSHDGVVYDETVPVIWREEEHKPALLDAAYQLFKAVEEK